MDSETVHKLGFAVLIILSVCSQLGILSKSLLVYIKSQQMGKEVPGIQ